MKMHLQTASILSGIWMALGLTFAGSQNLHAAKVPASPSDGGLRRFALIVGDNDGGSTRMRLRYAGTDASAFAEVLKKMGGISSQDLRLLQDPTRKDFLKAMDELRSKVTAALIQGAHPEILIYFSGHSDENGLMLGADLFTYKEFRARIDSIPARIRLAVVDACASGALTRIKGGSRLPAFSVDQSSNLSGYAFLTSSSGTEAAQESDRIRASFFTHYLLSGMRGAADRNADGRVTLGEAYEYAFQETLAQTEGTQAGAQHPSYDMRLTGTGDVVLTDLRGTSAGLVLDKDIRGRMMVRSNTGALVAELQKQAGHKVELGLDPGLYELGLDQGDSLFHALIVVDSLEHKPIAKASFTPSKREPTRSRGEASTPEKYTTLASTMDKPTSEAEKVTVEDKWINVRLAIVPSLGFPGMGPGPWSHNFSLNVLYGYARSIQGLQLASLTNYADSLAGVQLSIINHASQGTGLQVGLFNSSKNLTGMQIGLLNVDFAGKGAQVGLLNFADTSRGVQVGFFNYASHGESAVLGLINIIGNGLHDIEATVDERSMLRTALVLGGRYNYNYLSFDMKARYPRHLWGGSAGMGVHLPQRHAFADIDIGGGLVLNDVEWKNYSVTGRLRGVLGITPMRWFSVFAGATFNIEAWPASRFPNLNPNQRGEAWTSDIRAERWPGFLMGVRI